MWGIRKTPRPLKPPTLSIGVLHNKKNKNNGKGGYCTSASMCFGTDQRTIYGARLSGTTHYTVRSKCAPETSINSITKAPVQKIKPKVTTTTCQHKHSIGALHLSTQPCTKPIYYSVFVVRTVASAEQRKFTKNDLSSSKASPSMIVVSLEHNYSSKLRRIEGEELCAAVTTGGCILQYSRYVIHARIEKSS